MSKEGKEADFWDGEDNKVRCNLCRRHCLIPEGNYGFCSVRKNVQGELRSMNYGKIASINVDPIEKKPLFHFNPGSRALSFGTSGCNFGCKFCDNWQISKSKPSESPHRDKTPKEMVELAEGRNADGIAYTYTEPTIFYEYSRDVGNLAKEKDLYNIYVSNGYTEKEPIEKISEFVDAAVIGLKGFNEEFYKQYINADMEETLKGVKQYYENLDWLEVSCLVIPGHNDDLDELRELAKWIKENLSESVPLHFIRFFPAYKMRDLSPTEIQTLEKARENAMDVGLNYVYVGNTRGEGENTFCPNCGEKVIERRGLSLVETNLDGKKCSECGEEIDIYGEVSG